MKPRYARILSMLMTCSVLAALYPNAPALSSEWSQPVLFAAQRSLNLSDDEDKKAATRYPIILHHGLFGFKKILNLEYFHGVPQHLRKLGYEVYVTRVYPLGTIKRRASELARQIDAILTLSGKDKVNIIAHSMGGLDARYLVSELGYGDKVASISMIGTPNRGSYIADLLSTSSNRGRQLQGQFFELIGIDREKDPSLVDQALEAIYNCSEKFIERGFNKQIKDDERVYYQSWAGLSYAFRGDPKARPPYFDMVRPLFFVPYLLLRNRDGGNDGLVPLKSVRWGKFRGTLEADHLDQIGLFLRDARKSFSHLPFYDSIAEELRQGGF